MAPLLISSPWNPLASDRHQVLQQKSFQISCGRAGNHPREARGHTQSEILAQQHSTTNWSSERFGGKQGVPAPSRSRCRDSGAALARESGGSDFDREWAWVAQNRKIQLCHEWPGTEQCNNGDLPGQARISLTSWASCTPVALCASPRKGNVRRLWSIPSW